MNVSEVKAVLAMKKEAERLTDECGASVFQRLIWPNVLMREAGAAEAHEIEVLRGLLAGGDEAHVHGPLETFVVLAGPSALNYLEAAGEAFHGRKVAAFGDEACRLEDVGDFALEARALTPRRSAGKPAHG